MRWSIALLSVMCAAGCDRVFDLQDPPPIDALENEECPATYDRTLLNKKYRFVTTLSSWELAEADCRDDSVSAITHLPVFANVVEVELFRASINVPANGSVPVGYARDVDGDNTTFRAVTGAPLPVDDPMWGAFEPNGDAEIIEQTQVFIIQEFKGLVDAAPTWNQGPWPYMCQCDRMRATEVFVAL